MPKLILLALLILVGTTYSSEAEEPATDVRIPLESVGLDQIDQLEERLRLFGINNGLITFENDRRQMMIINGGIPAITFWYLVEEEKHPAITATTVNQGGFLRVMIFSDGFDDNDHMNRIGDLFLQQFQN